MPEDTDITIEPVNGLPEALPAGEQILWQGSPLPLRLARESLALYWVLGYFALLATARTVSLLETESTVRAIAAGMPFLFIGAAVGAGLYAFAWIQAKNSVYTITTERVVFRIGAAITMTINLPFKWIESADLMTRRDGTGAITLRTSGDTNIAYLGCWPHVRPWRMKKTEPALRAIPEAAKVAEILAEAAETRIAQPEITRDDTRVVAAE